VSQVWLEQRERGSIIGIRLVVGLALALGRPIARLALYPICMYFLLFSLAPRAASRKYLARVLGRSPRRADLFRHYLAFATVALDRFFLLKGRRDLFRTEVHGEEVLRQISRARSGLSAPGGAPRQLRDPAR